MSRRPDAPEADRPRSLSRHALFTGAAAAGAVTVLPGAARARERKVVGPDERGMLYDSTACIGCRACMAACKRVNQLPAERDQALPGMYDAPLDLSASTKTVVKLYQGDGVRAYVKRQCMHCADPACVSVCMAGALHREADGSVGYNKDVCVGCRYCQVACAFDIPKFTWNTPVPLIVKCELCHQRQEGPACCEACPRGAVVTGRMADLLAEAKRRLRAGGGRYLPHVYGEKEAGGTHVLYLTARAVPFEKLGLPRLGDEPVPQMSETIQHGLYKGFLAPLALYATFTVAQLWHRRRRDLEDGRLQGMGPLQGKAQANPDGKPKEGA
jgi:Fe-S-cluster-containing dehydrogenase component